MTRPALYLTILACAAALGIGSAFGASRTPEARPAADPVVKELRALKQELRKANDSTGYLGKKNTTIDLLYGIQRNTQVLCQQVDNYRCVGPTLSNP